MDKNEADNPLLNGSSSFDEILLNYDYHIDEAHKTNVIQSIYVSFKLLVGISIIALPNSFTNSGLIGGVIGVWMIGIINLITVLLQDSVSVKINKNITSYSMLGLAVFGYKGKIVIEIFLFIVQIGFLISYLIFTSTQIDQIICLKSGENICENRILILWMLACLITPLCWIKSMRKLSYVSFIFAAGMIFTYFVVLYYSGADIIDDQNYFNKIKQFDIHGIPYFFGIALLNFLGNNTSLNLRACMKDQSQFKFVFTFSSILVCSLGSFIGGLGYIRFGDDVKDIILLSLPDTKITLFVRVLYCFCLLGSYPLQMYSIIDIIERNDFYKSIPSFENIDIRYYAIRTLLVLTTAVVASTISKVGLFLNFSGSFAGTALGFIIPVIAYEKVFSGKMSTSTIIMNRCILVFGIVFGTICTVISFISLIQEF